MNAYLFLFGAITLEVIGTLLLPVSQNFSKPLPTTILTVCYMVSFYLMTLALKKLPLSIVYASWSGLGVFSVALFSYIFFKQSLSWQAIVGLFLIVVGVTLINVYRVPQ